MSRWRDGLLDGHPAQALVILSMVNLVDQVDTSVLRGVLPFIQDDFGLGDLQLGLLGFAFVFVNAIASIPAGWVADRYRRTRIIGWTILSWSGLALLSGAAVNYPHLFAARASLGFGQAIDDPASTSLLADVYPPQVRGRAFSVLQLTMFVGTGLGLGVGGVIGSLLGWRWAFVVAGVPGAALAWFVFRLREPTRGAADGRVVTTDAPASDLRPVAFLRAAGRSLIDELRLILGIRTMRSILVGVGTLLFTVSGVGFWAAVYHERHSGLTVGQATVFMAGVLSVAGIVGTVWGGRVADRALGTGPVGRITMVSNAILAGGALMMLSITVPWVPLRFGLQFFAVIALASAAPALRASLMDVVPAESRGVSTSAFALTATVFGTALAPPLVGMLSDVTGSLVTAFYLVAPPIFAGALILRRARTTIVEDVDALVAAIAARTSG